jgi:hypothetical protein
MLIDSNDRGAMAIVNRVCASGALLAWIGTAIGAFDSGATLFTALVGGMCVAGFMFISARAAIFLWALMLAPGTTCHDRQRGSSRP